MKKYLELVIIVTNGITVIVLELHCHYLKRLKHFIVIYVDIKNVH